MLCGDSRQMSSDAADARPDKSSVFGLDVSGWVFGQRE